MRRRPKKAHVKEKTIDSLLAKLYEPALAGARTSFFRASTLDTVLDERIDTDRLELFFIYFCALGVQMTQPVESWIDRAGRRCTDLGWSDLGRALRMHARHEADHHLMMIDDTRILVQRRNARLGHSLRADDILASPPTPGVRRYVQLHEQVIAGGTPFAQLAIEYEIENLSVVYGGKVLQQFRRRLGDDSLDGMSFLAEHVAVDVGHTKFNAAELERLLLQFPESADALAEAGTRALEAYAMFLSDCLRLADESSFAAPSPRDEAPPPPI
jgi:hypothetical protein